MVAMGSPNSTLAPRRLLKTMPACGSTGSPAFSRPAPVRCTAQLSCIHALNHAALPRIYRASCARFVKGRWVVEDAHVAALCVNHFEKNCERRTVGQSRLGKLVPLKRRAGFST